MSFWDEPERRYWPTGSRLLGWALVAAAVALVVVVLTVLGVQL